MPIRVCTGSPTCPNPAVYRGRCREHARQRDREISRAGYHIYRTAKWRHTRERQLTDHPLCQCGRIAEHVHHIIDLADGGDPWAASNLAGLCGPCHSRETRRRQA